MASALAIDMFRTELMSPPPFLLGPTTRSPGFLWEEEREIDLATVDLTAWQQRMTTRFASIRDVADQLSPETMQQGIADVIAAVTLDIRSASESLEKHERKFRRTLKYAQSKDVKETVERIGAKALAGMRNHHDFLVGMYYDLKALQADLDPNTKGGNAFTDAASLLAHLKKPRSAA